MGMDAAVMGMLDRIGRLEQRLERMGGVEVPGLKTTQVAIAATSTTSTTDVDMAGASLTASFSGRPVFVLVFFNALSSTPAGFVNVQVHRDGVNQLNMVFDDLTTARTSPFAGTINTPAAGSHTWKVRWAGTGGATVAHAGGYLAILEL